MVKYKFFIFIDGVEHSAVFDVDQDFGLPEEEWEQMTKEEQDFFLEEEYKAWCYTKVKGTWVLVSPDYVQLELGVP